jgi:hypothetical protein
MAAEPNPRHPALRRVSPFFCRAEAARNGNPQGLPRSGSARRRSGDPATARRQRFAENSLDRHGEGRIPGIFRLALSPHSPSQAQGQGPAGSLKMTKGFRSTFRGPKGPLFHQSAGKGGLKTHLDTRRPPGGSLFPVPTRRENGNRKGYRASGRHEQDFGKNAAEDCSRPAFFLLTHGRTNGKLSHFPPSEEKQ